MKLNRSRRIVLLWCKWLEILLRVNLNSEIRNAMIKVNIDKRERDVGRVGVGRITNRFGNVKKQQ